MRINHRLIVSLVLTAACLTVIATLPGAHAEMSADGAVVITNGPQAGPGDVSGRRSEAQNVRDSDRYDALVRSNPSYRAARERGECGPISDRRLQADCIASFGK